MESFPGITFALPVFCTESGELLVRPDTVDALLDPILISPEGRITARFGRENIPQFQHSNVLYAFAREHDVFLLIDGTTPIEHQITVQTPDGRTLQQQAVEHGVRLAHFDADGTFKGSFALNLPFPSSRFGEFANGDFLIMGGEIESAELHAAILNSMGQVVREIKLKRSPGKQQADKKLPFLDAQVTADGPNLLVFTNRSNDVFFVTTGGEVRRLGLQLPNGYGLDAVQPGRNELIVEASESGRDGATDNFAAFAIDRNSGVLRARFDYPKGLGFGMACTDGTDFTFLALDPEKHGVKLVKLTSAKELAPSN